MRKFYTIIVTLFLTFSVNAQSLIYSNDFEAGVGAATIVGNGAIETSTTPGFGKVFHNSAGGQAVRANYLKLADTVFTALQRSKSYKLSVGFWVNKGTATDFFFTPLFSAYGAAPSNNTNTWPMMVLQSRNLAQVNCAGWCDFSNADNAAGNNTESTAWLDDANWHYYTATLDTTSVKVYIDGVIKNAWNINGTDGHTIKGLFTNGSSLNYICLGGNQAWNWNDPDPAYLFDDVAIYSSVLTVDQINSTIAAKVATKLSTTNSEIVYVYPNPTSDYITVNGINGKAKVIITGLNGKTLSVKEISTGEQVSLKGLAKGSYLVKVISKNNTSIKKVLVK
jgi:hypothetical protein